MTNVSSPLIIQPQFSKKLALLIMITHCGACTGVWFANIPLIIQIFLTILICIQMVYHIQKHLFFKYRQVSHKFILQYDYILFENDLTATILPHVYVHAMFVILPLQLSNKNTETFIIFDDSLDESTFHYLRIRLLHPFLPKKY